jgi:hypothetical protein
MDLVAMSWQALSWIHYISTVCVWSLGLGTSCTSCAIHATVPVLLNAWIYPNVSFWLD